MCPFRCGAVNHPAATGARYSTGHTVSCQEATLGYFDSWRTMLGYVCETSGHADVSSDARQPHQDTRLDTQAIIVPMQPIDERHATEWRLERKIRPGAGQEIRI